MPEATQTSKFSRRFSQVIPVDAATVAISLPGVFRPDDDFAADANDRSPGAVVGFTGADGGYGVYQVLDQAGVVVGIEIVVSSPTAEKALELFLAEQVGWAPDSDFYERYFAKTASEAEVARYREYNALRGEHFGRFLDITVETLDPSEESSPKLGHEFTTADGQFEVGDPYCSMYLVSVSPGTYRAVTWVDRSADEHVFGNGTLRIGAYRSELGVGV